MARKRFEDSSTTVSLFPFLDALSGVIGILALVISAIAALNMKNAKQVIEYPDAARTKMPFYVECREEGLLIHPEKTVVSLHDVANARTAWDDRLREIASSANKYLVLLVRPNGIDCFYTAHDQARNAGIDLGYEAIDADGEVVIEQPST